MKTDKRDITGSRIIKIYTQIQISSRNVYLYDTINILSVYHANVTFIFCFDIVCVKKAVSIKENRLNWEKLNDFDD